MFKLALCALAITTSVAHADAEDVLTTQILPAFENLSSQTQALQTSTQNSCAPEDVLTSYHEAYDAWITASLYPFGPLEDLGVSLSFAFWPDPKNRVGKALLRLQNSQDPVVESAAAFAEVSAAAQGFSALELLLVQDDITTYDCSLIRAISSTLAANSQQLNAAWTEHAQLMLFPTNERYQSQEDVQRALYTALSTGLEFLHDQRLGRPLGTFDRPRPKRAEARRTGRSQSHILLSLAALRGLSATLADHDTPATDFAFNAAINSAMALEDPAFAGVAVPSTRIKVEALQRAVRDVQVAVASEIGGVMGISAGFNSLDGD